MNVLINNTELIVRDCRPFRYASGKLVLQIQVQSDQITHDDLKALIKGNTSDIIFTNDEGATQSFSGFGYAVKIVDNDDGYFDCELECKSETDYQLSIVQKQLQVQGETLDNHAYHISGLNGANSEQAATIETILLDVIPTMMEELIPAIVVETLESMNAATENI